jgi:hypothetical protein
MQIVYETRCTTPAPLLLCGGELSETADITVKVWSALLPQLYALGWQAGLCQPPGNLYPLEGAVWTGRGSFKEDVQGSWSSLYLHIFLSVASPVAGVPRNKLVTLEGPVLPTFIYTIYMLIWGLS